MNNVLIDDLPEEWHGYKVNTDFTIGIQMLQAKYDRELTDYEKSDMFVWLMFADEDENEEEFLRNHPQGQELGECVEWFLSGWFHDNPNPDGDKTRVVTMMLTNGAFMLISGKSTELIWLLWIICTGGCFADYCGICRTSYQAFYRWYRNDRRSRTTIHRLNIARHCAKHSRSMHWISQKRRKSTQRKRKPPLMIMTA